MLKYLIVGFILSQYIAMDYIIYYSIVWFIFWNFKKFIYTDSYYADIGIMKFCNASLFPFLNLFSKV